MRAAALAALIAAFYASAPASPAAGSCTETCDKSAATCVDGCEAKFPTDPGPRVTCKLGCAKQRGACESSCATH